MRPFTAADSSAVYCKAIVFNLIAQLIAGIGLQAYAYAAPGRPTGTLQFIGMLLFQVAFFVALATTTRRDKRPSLGWRRPPLRALLLAVPMLAVTLCCFVPAAEWFAIFLAKIGYHSSATLPFDGVPAIVVGVLAAGLVAPVVEETVFRGALCSGYERRFSPLTTVLLSGAAFSLMHMNPEQTVYQFALGCVCAWATLCSRSCLPAVLIHAGNNLFSLVLELTTGTGITLIGGLLTSPGMTAVAVIVSAVAAAAGVAAIWALGRLCAPRPAPDRPLSLARRDETAAEERAADQVATFGARTVKMGYIAATAICVVIWTATLILGLLG